MYKITSSLVCALIQENMTCHMHKIKYYDSVFCTQLLSLYSPIMQPFHFTANLIFKKSDRPILRFIGVSLDEPVIYLLATQHESIFFVVKRVYVPVIH